MRNIFKTLLISLILAPLTSLAGTIEITNDFLTAGQQALKSNTPIAILFNASNCNSCEKLKQKALGPIVIHDNYPEGTQFFEVFIDQEELLTDFYGEEITLEEFAMFYNITEIPSMIFVDGSGDKIARSIVNNGAYEFFYHILQKRFEEALENLKE